jgi:hypothetical protein
MAQIQKYNGWTNYETWCVALWIDNSEGSQRHWREEARECLARDLDETGDCVSELSERLKSEFHDAVHDLLEGARASASVFADLLGASLGEVDWYEIAESIINEERQAQTMATKFWLTMREGYGQPSKVLPLKARTVVGAKREAARIVGSGFADCSGELYARDPGTESSDPIGYFPRGGK